MGEANLYSNLADVCVKFYDLTVEPKEVADFIDDKLRFYKVKKAVFIGGFFLVAKELINKGYDLTIVDYTDEMVKEAKNRLQEEKIVKSDMRELALGEKFDAVIVIGRCFTHMVTNEDANKALQAFYRNLKAGGVLLLDNYSKEKIGKTNYFNGTVVAKDNKIEVIRESTTEQVSENPFVVNWKAKYTVKQKANKKEFFDENLHRAFTVEEIKKLLENNYFEFKKYGDNFDDTSFYVLGVKSADSVCYCKTCNKEIKQEEKTCPHCSADLTKPASKLCVVNIVNRIAIKESLRIKDKDKQGRVSLKHRINEDGTQHRITTDRSKKPTEVYHSVWKKGKLIHRDRKN